MSRMPIYTTWAQMIQRCSNIKNEHFKDYGGRGITVCDSWKNSFENFHADMGNRPKGKTIDRVNNNGNYEKSNCRWATPIEQAHNRRMNRNSKTGVEGICWHKGNQKYSVRIMLNGKRYNLGYFDTIPEAAEARRQGELLK